MNILPVVAVVVVFFSSAFGADCRYWKAQVDQEADGFDAELDEKQASVIIKGIECLLKEEGNRGPGLVFGSIGPSPVSQTTPPPSVQVSALYYISYLFYGNYGFSDAIALTRIPPRLKKPYDKIIFNSPSDIKTAYRSYRRWFKIVKKIGLDEARRQKLDPLAGSNVEWYH